MLISVITPTLNEASTLPHRAAELHQQEGAWEWLVADGGSEDGTPEVARALGARVVRAPRGRGPQLNAGAAEARGEALLFLHADTRLPPEGLSAIRAALEEPAVVGGNFELRFEGGDFTAHFFTGFYRVRRHLLHAYYGDSAIWARGSVFRQVGGFPAYPLMEDYEFVLRLERAGRTVCLPREVETSARRYQGRVARTVVLWLGLYGLFRLGVSPHRLARLYAPLR